MGLGEKRNNNRSVKKKKPNLRKSIVDDAKCIHIIFKNGKQTLTENDEVPRVPIYIYNVSMYLCVYVVLMRVNLKARRSELYSGASRRFYAVSVPSAVGFQTRMNAAWAPRHTS